MIPRIEERVFGDGVVVRDDATGRVLAELDSVEEAGLFVAAVEAGTEHVPRDGSDDGAAEPGFFDELFGS